jgi:hypothetical protein
VTTEEAAATFDARSFTRRQRRRFDDASARGRLEHAVRAAVPRRRTGVDVADRRAGAATLRLRVGPVCSWAASGDRRGWCGRRVGARADRGDGVVRRVRSRGRSRTDDSNRRRLFRDAAAARLDRRPARRRSRGRRARRRRRRELRRGHARAARAPGRSKDRRRGGLPRPARVPSRAPPSRASRARPRRSAASGAAAARAAHSARRAVRASASSRCSTARADNRSRRTDVERGARRRRAGTGRRSGRGGSRRGREAARRVGWSDRAYRSKAAAPACRERDRLGTHELACHSGARGTSRCRCKTAAAGRGRSDVVRFGGARRCRAHTSGSEARREEGLRFGRCATACLGRGARAAHADRRCTGPDRGAAEAGSYHGHG